MEMAIEKVEIEDRSSERVRTVVDRRRQRDEIFLQRTVRQMRESTVPRCGVRSSGTNLIEQAPVGYLNIHAKTV
jgi:hypothetical protein